MVISKIKATPKIEGHLNLRFTLVSVFTGATVGPAVGTAVGTVVGFADGNLVGDLEGFLLIPL